MQALLDLGLTQEQIGEHDCSDEEILSITLIYLQQRPDGVSITDAMQEICGLGANEIHMRHLGFSLEEAQSHPNHLSEIVAVLYRALELGLPKEALKGHGWGSPELAEATLTYLKERPDGVSITDAMDDVRGRSAYDVYEAQLLRLGLEPYEIARLGLFTIDNYLSVMDRKRLHQVVLFIQAKRDAGEDIHQAIQSVEDLSAATIMAIRHGWLTKVDDEQGYRDLFRRHESTKVLEDALALGLRQDQLCDHPWSHVDTAHTTLKFLQKRPKGQSAIDAMDQILGLGWFYIEHYDEWSTLGLTAKMLSNHYCREKAFDEMMGYLKKRIQEGQTPALAMEEIRGIPSGYVEFEKVMRMPIPVDERADHAWRDKNIPALTRYYLQERPSWQSFEQAWREIKGKDARDITDRVLLRLGWSLRDAREKNAWDVKEFFSSIPLIRDFEVLGLMYNDLRGVPLSSELLSYVQGRVEDGQNASRAMREIQGMAPGSYQDYGALLSFGIPQEEREGYDWRDARMLEATIFYLQERPEGQEILNAWHEIKGLLTYEAIYEKALSRSYAILAKQDGDQGENLDKFSDFVRRERLHYKRNIKSLKLIADQLKKKKESATKEIVEKKLRELQLNVPFEVKNILIKITDLGLNVSQFEKHIWSQDIAESTLSYLESRPKEQTISEAMLEIHGWPSSAIESLPEFKKMGLTPGDLRKHFEYSEEGRTVITLEYLRERISQGVYAKEALDEIEGLDVDRLNLLKTGLKKADVVDFDTPNHFFLLEVLPHLEERPIGQSIQDAWHIARTCKTAYDLRGLRWGLPLGEISHSAVFNLLNMSPKKQWSEVLTETRGLKTHCEVLALMLDLKVSDLKDHLWGVYSIDEASLHFLRTSSLPIRKAMEAIRGLDTVGKIEAIALGLKKTELDDHCDWTSKTIEYLKKRIQEGQSPALALDEIRGLDTHVIELMLLGVPRDALQDYIGPYRSSCADLVGHVKKRPVEQSVLAAFYKVRSLSKEEVKLLELGLSKESIIPPSVSGDDYELNHDPLLTAKNIIDIEEALILGVDRSQFKGHDWLSDSIAREALQYLRGRPLNVRVDEAMANIHGMNEAQIKAIGLGLLRKEVDGHDWEGRLGHVTVEYLEGRPISQTPASAMDEIRGVKYIWAIRAMRLGLPREELKGHDWGAVSGQYRHDMDVIGAATFEFLKQHRKDIVSAMEKIRGLKDVAAIKAIALGLTREEIKGHRWGKDYSPHVTLNYLREGSGISVSDAMKHVKGMTSSNIFNLHERMKNASLLTGFPLYVFYLKKFEVDQFSLIKKGTPWHQACPEAATRYMHTSGMLSSLVGMFCASKREKGPRSHLSRLTEVVARRIAAFLTVEDLRMAYAVNASISKGAAQENPSPLRPVISKFVTIFLSHTVIKDADPKDADFVAKTIASFLSVKDVNEILPQSKQFSGETAKALRELAEQAPKIPEERVGAWCKAQLLYLS